MHVEIVLDAAMIEIARKVIILDPKEMSALTLLGIATLIVTLSSAGYLEKQARRADRADQKSQASSR